MTEPSTDQPTLLHVGGASPYDVVVGHEPGRVVSAAQVAGRLEECADLSHEQARRRLLALPGVGRWTAAEVAQRALGDADAVSFGDYHLARNVTYALTGQIGDDDDLAELLEPYAATVFRDIADVWVTGPEEADQRYPAGLQVVRVAAAAGPAELAEAVLAAP